MSTYFYIFQVHVLNIYFYKMKSFFSNFMSTLFGFIKLSQKFFGILFMNLEKMCFFYFLVREIQNLWISKNFLYFFCNHICFAKSFKQIQIWFLDLKFEFEKIFFIFRFWKWSWAIEIFKGGKYWKGWRVAKWLNLILMKNVFFCVRRFFASQIFYLQTLHI